MVLFMLENFKKYVSIVFLISLSISLIFNIVNFNLKDFIKTLLESMILLYFAMSLIIHFTYRLKGIDKWDEFFYKLIIIDTVFFCILILLEKYKILG